MRRTAHALSVALLIAIVSQASPALAASHAYTPQRPAHDETLRHGKLGTQVNFSKGPTFQWSWVLNAATYRAATGPMVEDADLYCDGSRVTGYHDHHVVPAFYLVHSSFKPLKTSCNYQLAVNETFPIRGGVRLVFLRYYFYISYA